MVQELNNTERNVWQEFHTSLRRKKLTIMEVQTFGELYKRMYMYASYEPFMEVEALIKRSMCIP